MHSVTHGFAVYVFLLIIFRVAGKRTLSQTTNFDLVLLLIISETTQQAMVHNDNSVTNSFLLIVTLVSLTVIFSHLKQRYPRLDVLLEGAPLVLVERGVLLNKCLERSRIDKEDILEAGRQNGLRSMEQIDYAILERNGEISIIAKGEDK